MKVNICPQCKSRATKVVNISTGNYECQICDHRYKIGSPDLYVKSLENFMIRVAKELKCLPDFNDPENGNEHIFRAISELKKE